MEHRSKRPQPIWVLWTTMIVLGCVVLSTANALASTSIVIKQGNTEVGNEITVGANGETVTLDVQANSTISVSKPSENKWIALHQSGNQITLTIKKNSITLPRSTSITVYAGMANKIVAIKQNGAVSATPTLFVDNNASETQFSWSAEENGESKGWLIHAEGGSGSWTVSENVSWIRTTTSDLGLTLTLEPNTNTETRTADVLINYSGIIKTIKISQQGGSTKQPTPKQTVTTPPKSGTSAQPVVEATLAVNMSKWTPKAEAASSTVNVTKSFGSGSVSVAKSAQSSWLTVTKAEGDSYTFSVQENTTDASRSAQVTFSYSGKTATVSVVQRSVALTVSSYFFEVSSQETTKNVEVTGSGGSGDVSFVKGTNVDWLDITETVNGLYALKIKEHTGQNDREVAVHFSYSGKTASINVKQTAAKLDVSPTSIQVFSNEKTSDIAVSAQGGYGDVAITGVPGWMSVTPDGEGRYKANIQQLTSTTDRTATVTFTYAKKSKVVTITQKAATLTVNPKTINMLSAADNPSVVVEAKFGFGNIDVEQTAGTSTWLNVVKGTGNTYTFNVEENESATDRSAQVTFAYAGRSEIVQVTQKAAKLTVSPSPVVFHSVADSQNITVNARDGYGIVSMTKTASWLTVTNNNGTYTFGVPAYTGDDDRTATVTFAYASKRVDVTVTQKAVELRVSQGGLSYSSAGGASTVLVTAKYGAGDVRTSQSSGYDWLTVEDKGSGSYAFAVKENEGDADRSATVVFGYTGKSVAVTVTQTAAKLTVSPTEIEVHAEETTRQIAVNAVGGYGALLVADSATWISAAPDGSGRYKVSIDKHTGTTDRTATVTFTYAKKSVTVTVTQKAVRLTVDPKTIQWNSGANAQDVTVVAQYGYGAVTVTNTADWLNVQQQSGGYKIGASEHTEDSDRSAAVTFAYSGRSETVNVSQKAAKLTVNQTSLVFDGVVGTKDITVFAQDGYGTVRMTKTADWLTVTNNNGTYTFGVPAHTGDDDRTATVTFAYASKRVDVTVTQKAVELRVSQGGLSYSSAGGASTVLVTAKYGAGDVRTSQSSGYDWLTVEDKGSGSYAFAVKENEGDADRSATVVFGYTGKSVTVSVTQTAAQLTVSPTEIEVHADAESSHFGVKEEGGYGGVVAQTGTSWLRVTQDYKTASGWSMYKIDADANDGTGDRTATVTFTYAKKSATVTVTQKAVRLSNSGDLDNATDVLVSRNLTLSFNKKIVFGSSGTITLVGLNGGSNVAIDVTNHGGQLSIAGNVLTINPTNDLAGSGQYAVNISAGALRDTAGNAYAGISDTTTVNFTTQAAVAGMSSIALGSGNGQLIMPVTIDGGNVYYFWDRNSSGVADEGDKAIYTDLAKNLGTTTNAITERNRNFTVNGVHVRLPTDGNTASITHVNPGTLVGGIDYAYGLDIYTPGQGIASDNAEGLYTAKGTATNDARVNVSYDDYLAIWDALNGAGTNNSVWNGSEWPTMVGGAPAGWVNNAYWTATPSYSGHVLFSLDSGNVWEYDHSGLGYVALQVPTMAQVGIPGVTYSVPIGSSETNTNIAGGFLIGSTEVTYEEWYSVRTWAEKNRYTFQNKGMEGHDGAIGAVPTEARFEPVTSVSWRDVIVWSNAKSEKEGLDPVYRGTGNTVLRDARPDAVDEAVQSLLSNGYRLPTLDEWEMAARWLGTSAPANGSLASDRRTTIVNGATHYWTPDGYASGAVYPLSNLSESNEVGTVYESWNGAYTSPVGRKRANALGMVDMAGNVFEYVWDWAPGFEQQHLKFKGGSWWIGSVNSNNGYFNVAGRWWDTHSEKRFDIGFRLAMTRKGAQLSTSNPLDNNTNVPVGQNLTLTFSENVAFGSSGTITLVGLNGGSNVAIDVTNHGGQLSIAGNVLTINPTNDLAGSGQYAVNISAGALRDTAGNAYAGISDTTTVNFTTQAVYIASQEPNMVQVGIPGVTYTVPIGRDETNTNIAGGFLIGTTEVTYQEWYDVRTWAESNGYTFQNKGREGHDGTIGAIPTEARFEPVTSVSWRDVVVWSNAKSEKEGLDPVYRGTGNVVLRDAHNGAVDTAEQSSLAHGYRLPTNHEWEMAARWLGATAPTSGTLGIERRSTTVDGVVYYWSPFNYASGANTTSLKEIADVAWYFYNSNYETQPTRNKRANVLGIYDLSGNAAEWTSDMRRRDVYWGGYQGLVRGGAAVHGSSAVMVFNVSVDSTIAVRSYTGFRIAKTQ